MTGNQTTTYYVWPRHLYSHSSTCTHSGLCRILSRLVAFHICYLLDHSSVHEISTLVTWFQCMSDIFIHYGDLDPLYIFNFYGDIDPFVYLHHGYSDLFYIVRGNDHTCHILYIMPIHGHCTLMYLGLLYVFAVICRYWLLYYTNGWLVLPLGSSSLHFWDGLIMYFGDSITPGICYNWFYHTWLITHLWPSLSLCRLFGPHGPFLYLWCFQYHP